jgi:hypothetical protein
VTLASVGFAVAVGTGAVGEGEAVGTITAC